MEPSKKNITIIVFLLLAAANGVVWYALWYAQERQALAVTFFDVGQGDAAFIEVPNGNQILIDGGPGSAVLARLGSRMPFWDRSIDAVILTHPHADHVAGLLEVLGRYTVGVVLESGVGYATPEYEEWRELLQRKNVSVFRAVRGQIIDAGRGTTLEILSPSEDFSNETLKNPHDANVVSRLRYGNHAVLFMGDAEKSVEYRLVVESAGGLSADILKVGHHGSKTSSAEEFLRSVSPRYAVISSGRKNRYGHPHGEVLERFRALGIEVARTDISGNITFASDGTYVFKR